MSGANVFGPGLTSPGGRITKCNKDKIVVIMAEDKQHALAIGIMKMSTDEMYDVISILFTLFFYNYLSLEYLQINQGSQSTKV